MKIEDSPIAAAVRRFIEVASAVDVDSFLDSMEAFTESVDTIPADINYRRATFEQSTLVTALRRISEGGNSSDIDFVGAMVRTWVPAAIKEPRPDAIEAEG